MAGAVRAHDLGLSVLIVEKSDVYGGSSAMSGGVCWVGNNPYMKKYGIADSDEEVLTYLEAITKGEASRPHLVAYRDGSKRMIAYFAEKTHLIFDALDLYTDYYPEAPGGKMGGRSMEPEPWTGCTVSSMRSPGCVPVVQARIEVDRRRAETMVVSFMAGIPVEGGGERSRASW